MKKALGLAVVAVFVLTGCGGVSTVGDMKTSAPTASRSTPTPKPTETKVEVSTKPALRDLVLSPEGIGPLVLGEAVPSFAAGTEPVLWDDTFCGFDDAAYDYGNWQTNYDLTSDGKWTFLAEVTYFEGTTSSPIEKISVKSDEIRTKHGLGIGSTVDQLDAAYGSDLGYFPAELFSAYAVQGSFGQLVFWVDQGDPEVVHSASVISGFAPPVFYYHVSGCA